MPLRDHFHPPLTELRHWESFYSRWASVIADILDGGLLPAGYFAEVQIHLGGQVEVDVAAFEEDPVARGAAPHEDTGGTATAVAAAPARLWAPPAADMTWPAVFPDRLEVVIFHGDGGPTLVAAIELVSPRNKDRLQSRRAFASKCAAYLQRGVGVVVVDVVSSRRAILHNELIRLLELDEQQYGLQSTAMYASAYRPVARPSGAQIEAWHRELQIGQSLPTLPLPLDKGRCVPLDLEKVYTQACARSRLPSGD